MGLVLGAVCAGFLALYLRPSPGQRVISRFAFALPSPGDQPPASEGFPLRDFPAVTISRDGTKIAYIGARGETTQVFLRAVDHLEPQPLPGSTNATSPFFSPDGQWVGFFADGKLKKVPVHGGEATMLCDAPINRSATWGPDNTIIFAPTLFGGLMRVSAAGGSPEIVRRLEVTGQPVPVLDGVKTSPNSGAADFMVSDTGSLVYLPESANAHEGLLVWVDRKKQIKELAAPARYYGSPHISRDGGRVAVSIPSGNSGSDVWVYEIPHSTLTRLTFDEHSTAPLWSPDGKQIAFTTYRRTGSVILVKPADGSGAEETLVPGESLILVPTSWSSDGNFLAYWTVGAATGRDVWIAPITGDRKPQPFLRTKFNEMQARFSPDDRWVAYMSEESGRYEVYVQPFPGPGGKWQISTNGGTVPVWGQSGRELFFMSSGKLMSVGVTTQPTFSASTPRIVADIPPALMGRLTNGVYDVSPDGQRFLFVKANVESGPPDEVRVVLNWTEELKQLAPTPNQP
jgi:Tol biopolymer transport system component